MNLEKILSIISIIVSIGTLVWKCISENENRKLQEKVSILEGKFQKELSILNDKLDRTNYVSKVVFDKIFNQFELLSNIMFKNYNNVKEFFLPISKPDYNSGVKRELAKMMVDKRNSAKNDLNELVKLIQINRFILTSDMIKLLSNFETLIKDLFNWYDNKIYDVVNGDSSHSINRKKYAELNLKADNALKMYNRIENFFKRYIAQLQIVD